MRSKVAILAALLLTSATLFGAEQPPAPQPPFNLHAAVDELKVVACLLAVVVVALQVIAWIVRPRPIHRLRACPLMIFVGGFVWGIGWLTDDPFVQPLGMGIILGASCIEHCGLAFRTLRKLIRRR